MFKWLVNRRLKKFEREFDYNMDYVREILAATARGFLAFSKALSLAKYREGAPREATYAASIAATLAEDCGPCTQLVVTMAEREDVSPATLRAILLGDGKGMPPDGLLGYRFAQAVLARDLAESDRLRAEVAQKWGRRAVVSLALTIASSRIFPTVKYALGYGRACSHVRVAGEEVGVAARGQAA